MIARLSSLVFMVLVLSACAGAGELPAQTAETAQPSATATSLQPPQATVPPAKLTQITSSPTRPDSITPSPAAATSTAPTGTQPAASQEESASSLTSTPRPRQTSQSIDADIASATPMATRQAQFTPTSDLANQPPGEILFYEDEDILTMAPAAPIRGIKEIYADRHYAWIEPIQGFSWSPDGEKVAFAMVPSSDIYSLTLGESEVENLTKTTSYYEMEPAWSPNGKLIAYVSNRRQVDGEPHYDIYTMRSDGSGAGLLFECTGECHNPEWSPDGKQIVYQMDNELFIMQASGTKPRQLTSGGGVNRFPAWSPDGQWIAFIRSATNEPPAYIYLVKPDGSGLRALTKDVWHPRLMSWSPDSKYIAFENFHSSRYGGPAGIFILNVQTEEIWLWRPRVGNAPAWRPMKLAAGPSPTPASPSGQTDCTNGWTRLQVGDQAQVSGSPGDAPNRVRELPDPASSQIGLLEPGTVVTILEGPVCVDGLVFWKVASPDLPAGSGWTAEGDGSEYWLNPYPD